MTRVDYSRARNRIALVKERAMPKAKAADIDMWLTENGYAAKTGTYARLMTNGRPNRHMINTLCVIFGCARESMITDHEWDNLPECTATTHDHR